MESWTPRDADYHTPVYLLLVMVVAAVQELLLYDPLSSVGDAVVRRLSLAIGMAGGLAFVHLARWHCERKAA